MSLHPLLDENISQVVAEQAMYHQPAMSVKSAHTWQGGAFKGRSDRALLLAARAEGLTLVTYDQKTIPPLLADLHAEGESHAGVVFVDDQTITSNNFGMLIRALIPFGISSAARTGKTGSAFWTSPSIESHRPGRPFP